MDLLGSIDKKKAISILILGLISGVLNFLFLAFINYMIGSILKEKTSLDLNYIIIFCSLLLIFMWSRRALSYIVIKFSQQVFWKFRSNVLQTILKANFSDFSRRKDQIHTTIIHDVSILTNFSLSIIQFLSALIMTIGCLLYLGTQSKFLLLITFGVSISGIVLYSIGAHFNKKKFSLSRELEKKFIKSFLDIMSGFKEIHMNPKIGKDIFNKKIRKASNESFINNTNAFSGFLNLQLTSEVLFYGLIAFILIFSSFLITESPTTIVNSVFILLYLLGSINSLMQIIPSIVQARIAYGKINKLKQELNDERFEDQIENTKISLSEFRNLNISNLLFTYGKDKDADEKNKTNFSIGPLNISLKKGEVIFVYGGNGSGKTTLINVILGILKADSGTISFNKMELNQNNYSDYRALFSVVFSDFYLFEELYGLEDISENEINMYLKMFELNEKVFYTKNSFSSNDLSAGQRKRLALIIALLRSNPILVLDEWAADQDPAFRKKFYTQIIPELKNQGISIIAITHDDAYYHVADKLYKMEFGQLTIEPLLINVKNETV